MLTQQDAIARADTGLTELVDDLVYIHAGDLNTARTVLRRYLERRLLHADRLIEDAADYAEFAATQP